eukprot:2641106-Pleurochrysis_carterae.AAC.1
MAPFLLHVFPFAACAGVGLQRRAAAWRTFGGRPRLPTSLKRARTACLAVLWALSCNGLSLARKRTHPSLWDVFSLLLARARRPAQQKMRARAKLLLFISGRM